MIDSFKKALAKRLRLWLMRLDDVHLVIIEKIKTVQQWWDI